MKAISNPESEAIRSRFFQAMQELRARKLGSIYEFAKKYDLDTSNIRKLKTAERQPIPGWYLAAIVKDYGISAEWLLLGKGDPFTQH
ncbi:hypothetical protein [Dyadobacter chenhuakuii]|uniref:Uncharacterized protein n=1 Tax=Dyadobacter chenhuakuii TaxID=2909339 RepID=A0A9X1QC44_9BACT|nr:hypothetical protein [Dyadobacter chenhuakuii]MCF2498411.1 hypothetical protein [Dyadobacter chenhuakuii]